MKRLAIAAAFVAACASAVAPKPAPVVRVPVAVPTEADAAAPPADAGVRPALPSGHYRVSTEVTRDTCGDGIAPPPASVLVEMKLWHGELTGNFPLPVPPPTPAAGRNHSTLRSDIALWPATSSKPLSIFGLGIKCLDYETKTHYRVVSLTDNEVRFEYSREYGDASHCPPSRKAPEHCALAYVYTFTLESKLCAAGCEVTFARDRDGDAGAIPKCACP